MKRKTHIVLAILVVIIGLLLFVLPAAEMQPEEAVVSNVKEGAKPEVVTIESGAKTTEDEVATVRSRLQVMIPPSEASQAKISATGIQGLYQVQLGMTVVYLSADGQFLINGNVIDLDTSTNLTQQVQFEFRKAIMAEMSQESMIVYPAAAGVDKAKHSITVFTDIDCPYCVKLHKEIPLLNAAGINVRYLAYPRSGPNTPSYFKAVSAWCADDQVKSMDDAMSGLAPKNKQCKHPIDEHMNFANRLEVNGTPNILLENGDLLPGYVPARKLIGMLN